MCCLQWMLGIRFGRFFVSFHVNYCNVVATIISIWMPMRMYCVQHLKMPKIWIVDAMFLILSNKYTPISSFHAFNNNLIRCDLLKKYSFVELQQWRLTWHGCYRDILIITDDMMKPFNKHQSIIELLKVYTHSE